MQFIWSGDEESLTRENSGRTAATWQYQARRCAHGDRNPMTERPLNEQDTAPPTPGNCWQLSKTGSSSREEIKDTIILLPSNELSGRAAPIV